VHGNYEQYKRYIWQCTNYIKNGKRSCPKCKAIREEILEGAFVDAFNLLCQDEKKRKILTEALKVSFDLMESLAPSDELDKLKEKLAKEKERKQKSRETAERFQHERSDEAFVEVLSFNYYADHVDFDRIKDGLKKNLRNSSRVSMVIPVIADAAAGALPVPAAS